MTSVAPITLLETNLLSFYVDLSELFPQEKSFVKAYMLIGTKVSLHAVIQYILGLDKHDIQSITDNSEQYLSSINPILSFIDSESALYFSKIWHLLDKTEKDVIWSYFLSFIKLAKRCV